MRAKNLVVTLKVWIGAEVIREVSGSVSVM